MKYLNKGTDQAVKTTGLITGSRKANKTHSPEVHAMSKPGSGVRTNARILNIPYFAVWSWLFLFCFIHIFRTLRSQCRSYILTQHITDIDLILITGSIVEAFSISSGGGLDFHVGLALI